MNKPLTKQMSVLICILVSHGTCARYPSTYKTQNSHAGWVKHCRCDQYIVIKQCNYKSFRFFIIKPAWLDSESRQNDWSHQIFYGLKSTVLIKTKYCNFNVKHYFFSLWDSYQVWYIHYNCYVCVWILSSINCLRMLFEDTF